MPEVYEFAALFISANSVFFSHTLLFIYAFSVLTINSGYFFTWQSPTALSIENLLCFLWGTDWSFIYNTQLLFFRGIRSLNIIHLLLVLSIYNFLLTCCIIQTLHVVGLSFFLGVFTKFRKVTISFVMCLRPSVLLSVRMKKLGSHWTDLDRI